ncbi:unnamed protein product [Periconia digitata]|uniref:Uncharacterized protein n=1 Tax=Periconia digitata TaxID=1303443 RepID=A0A9W4UWH6_9PLEO|nr:unnamed protein product [Periconia digitata]
MYDCLVSRRFPSITSALWLSSIILPHLHQFCRSDGLVRKISSPVRRSTRECTLPP